MQNERLISILEEVLEGYVSTTEIEEVIATLRQEVAVKNAKSAGKQDLYKAMMAVIKSAKKHHPHQEGLHGAWIDDGKQYVSNGYMLIENSGTPLDLPTLPDDAKPMNVQPIIKARAEKEYPDTLVCPTIAELKSGIKEQKALAKYKYDKIRDVRCHLGGGHVANAEYLQIAVQATGSTTVHAENHIAGRDDQYQVGELWFESDDGTVRVLVLPVRGRPSDDSIGFDYSK
ncbi:hypothetical protein [Butyricicoccus intestinisimiae]|uniref:Uncharacterized protein n=1 Tax=Butyricicoccus intestinisimiae TaxID=2841509 RepID=A0ABS6EVT8_9FIRM|nr:hypothetical protein [Butyricicoccus intestinisimiae]MBU5491246.1 hypothetical protein [Butyricicoccus intestinisimiae]